LSLAQRDETILTKELVNWFSNENLLKKFLSYFDTIILIKNHRLIQQGTTSSQGFYILKKGKLQITITSKYNKNNKELVVGTILPGALVGEIAFFSQEARTASVTALEDCEIYHLSQRKYKEMEEKDPEIAKILLHRIIKLLSIKLQHSNELIQNLN